jgi:2,3-bisphosphoglycerate-independent phosphoglycerate mutase
MMLMDNKHMGESMKKPLVLCIMDGVGINNDTHANAVAMAKMPFWDSLLKQYPHSKLDASGVAVGLPDGTMGNSEVGHITIGAGRVVNQFLRRFQLENWADNQALNKFIADVKSDGGVVHVGGLMSDGRVHSDVNDIIVIVRQVLKAGLDVFIHFIADGRDTPPQSSVKYVDLIQNELAEFFAAGRVKWGTVSGRYYAMDRNQNHDRTELAFNAIANASAEYSAPSALDAIKMAAGRGETDEFIKPTVIDGDLPICKCDGFLFGNYRSDRARQIMRAILKTDAHILCFSQYGEGLNELCPALIEDMAVENTLGDVLAANGKSQLRIAETEKYNHVTYFMDAEHNVDFEGETKILIPSPDVATFDMKPEMSAIEITDALLQRLGEFDVVILNWANGDMVGHTGNLDAAINAMQVLDAQLAKLVPAVLELDGVVLITADHGNAEQLWDNVNDGPWTAHTTNPVNLVVVSNGKIESVSDGGLADIAPTMLKILGIEQPQQMTGHSLV